MSDAEESLVTGEMLGLFVVFGADIVLLVVLLAVAGVVSAPVAGLVVAAVLAPYAGWLLARWWRLRDRQDPDAVETLKQRYAAGELSEAEFERRLDTVLDSPAKLDTILDSPTEGDGDADGRELEADSEREAERVR